MENKKEKKTKKIILLDYFEKQRLFRKAQGSSFTAVNYQSAMQSVRRFLKKKAATFAFADISREWLRSYIMYMRETDHLSANSANSYLGILHAVYNRAIVEGVIRKPDVDPFLGVSVVVPPTRKRALPADGICALIGLDLSKHKGVVQARDLSVFLFFGRGMCFVDVFNLRWTSIENGSIFYQRSKTKAPMSLHIEPEMQDVIDRYSEKGGEYVFPFLRRNCYHPEKEVSEPSAIRRFNRHLNKLGELLHLTYPLTSYVARHSWASLAENSEMNLSLISQSLGHSSENTTRIYLKGFSSSELAEANTKMLDKMIRKKEEERCLILSKNETFTLFHAVRALINNGYDFANVRINI